MKLDKLNSKQLFFIDGLGALVTATMLLIISIKFQEYFGLPKKILLLLSLIAFLFSVYSIVCGFLTKKKWRFYLLIIAVLNLSYCFLTTFLLLYFFKKITVLGFGYFSIEITIIIVLSFLEIKKVKSSTL